MDNPIVQLPIDTTGVNPNNLVSGEEHLLVALDGFPYKIITLFHGGFYEKGLRVYDSSYDELTAGIDYICTYKFDQVSIRTGQGVFDDIVFINPAITGMVYVSAQMVGGDLAYSFTAIQDYLDWYHTQPPGYVPQWADYSGYEPQWLPGELDQKRLGLDTYQPANNTLEEIACAVLRGHPETEQGIRDRMDQRLKDFLTRFNTRLDNHIADRNNPHQDTAEKIGLGVVANLTLANREEAVSGGLNTVYLTPALARAIVDDLAAVPLNAHIKDVTTNPHRVNYIQTNTHPKVQADAIIEAKTFNHLICRDATAIRFRGNFVTFAEYVALMRQTLDVGMFPYGQLKPNQIATGTANARTILRGDRRYTSLDDLLAEYSVGGSPEFVTIVATSNNPIATKQTLDLTMPYKPLGSVAMTTINQPVAQGYGNGENYYSINVTYVYVMSPSGWTLT